MKMAVLPPLNLLSYTISNDYASAFLPFEVVWSGDGAV